jgi:hypothetical protein
MLYYCVIYDIILHIYVIYDVVQPYETKALKAREEYNAKYGQAAVQKEVICVCVCVCVCV